MIGMEFWNLLFGEFRKIYNWLVSTDIVSWTDDDGSHSISYFAVLVSYLVLMALIEIPFYFVQNGKDDDDTDE